MKKIITLLVILTISVNLFGQDISTGPEFRKHRFGLKGTPGVAYFGVNKPGKKNKGLGYHIGGGLNYEYSLSKNVAIASGLIFSQTTGKVEYLDTLGLDYVSISNGAETRERAYRLHSRSYVFKSVDIPLKFKFRTPEIGYLTYYGEFGSTVNIITGAFARKNLVTLNDGDTQSLLSGNETTLDANDEVFFLRGGVNFGAGVEWNVAGNTSLLLGLNGNLGFTNILKTNSPSISYDNRDAFKRATNLNYIALQLGVQF
tara:strand:+ start:4127 stop:4900 length:774 start_codon:yes stop_codon:yes gene_type:complete